MAERRLERSISHRSAARLAAVQALYVMEVAGCGADGAVADVLSRHWSGSEAVAQAEKHRRARSTEPDKRLLRTLVDGVTDRRQELDVTIEEALDRGWSLPRLELLLQVILRAGAYELAACSDVPTKVVINEYLELSHAFFAGREPNLVNAVLDRVASRFRPSGEGTPGATASIGD